MPQSLLPVTDVVVPFGADKKAGDSWTAYVPFQTAREIGGSLWTNADVPFGPERFRVSGAFTAEQKAALLSASRPTNELV